MAGRPLMIEWLKQELETAKAELDAAERREAATESALDGIERGYWNGYTDAITNALHELTGMENE